MNTSNYTLVQPNLTEEEKEALPEVIYRYQCTNNNQYMFYGYYPSTEGTEDFHPHTILITDKNLMVQWYTTLYHYYYESPAIKGEPLDNSWYLKSL